MPGVQRLGFNRPEASSSTGRSQAVQQAKGVEAKLAEAGGSNARGQAFKLRPGRDWFKKGQQMGLQTPPWPRPVHKGAPDGASNAAQAETS